MLHTQGGEALEENSPVLSPQPSRSHRALPLALLEKCSHADTRVPLPPIRLAQEEKENPGVACSMYKNKSVQM